MAGAKKTKYNSESIVIDGIKFASKDEGKYYEAAKLRQARGEIKGFEMQVKYVLIPSFDKLGKHYKPITYTVDFVIYHNDGSKENIDVKGMTTQQGELRIKLFDYYYPDEKLSIVARSLKYGDQYGFIDFYELKKIRKKNKKIKNK